MSSILTYLSAPHIWAQMRGGGVAVSQPMRTAVHPTWHGAQINFGDLTPDLTYGATQKLPRFDWSIARHLLESCWGGGVEDLPEVQHGVEEGVLGPGLAIKKPIQKNPQKNQKTHQKCFFCCFFVFFWFFKFFLFFMKVIQTFLFETDFYEQIRHKLSFIYKK